MQTVINVEVPLIISYLSASLYTFILKGFHKFADVQKKKNCSEFTTALVFIKWVFLFLHSTSLFGFCSKKLNTKQIHTNPLHLVQLFSSSITAALPLNLKSNPMHFPSAHIHAPLCHNCIWFSQGTYQLKLASLPTAEPRPWWSFHMCLHKLLHPHSRPVAPFHPYSGELWLHEVGYCSGSTETEK